MRVHSKLSKLDESSHFVLGFDLATEDALGSIDFARGDERLVLPELHSGPAYQI